jgi:flagellar hook-basal body complex protein FliE
MNNLSIQNHLRSISGVGQLGARPEINPLAPPAQPGKAEGTEGPSFKDMLAESIGKVNGLMNESDQAIEDLATGKSANVHHTLIALQKADISFRMLLDVRNKVMSAYQEVMRMQA